MTWADSLMWNANVHSHSIPFNERKLSVRLSFLIWIIDRNRIQIDISNMKMWTNQQKSSKERENKKWELALELSHGE